MFTVKERDRRIAASEKRRDAAVEAAAKHEAKLEDAKAARATAEGEVAWLREMPVSDEETIQPMIPLDERK